MIPAWVLSFLVGVGIGIMVGHAVSYPIIEKLRRQVVDLQRQIKELLRRIEELEG